MQEQAQPEVMASEPAVVLSVVGHNKLDPRGVLFLENILTEQIQNYQPDVKIMQVVLDHHDPNDGSKIGYIPPEGHPKAGKPKMEWLNFYAPVFYAHLREKKVTHILAHAPEFAWAAIHIKMHFFPDATMIMLIHEQIESKEPEMVPGEELIEWSHYADVIISLGSRTYEDVDVQLHAYGKSFSDIRKLCYIPKAPKIFAVSQWEKPPSTRTHVIAILAGDLHTQATQKRDLRTIMKATNAVAELLYTTKGETVTVRVIGIPKEEKDQLEKEWETFKMPYLKVQCLEACTHNQLVTLLRGCCMCILPFGCNSSAYGLEMIIPVTFGMPTLLPNSTSIAVDAKHNMMTTPEEKMHLMDMVVNVLDARNKEEEVKAWTEKIISTVVNSGQSQTGARVLRKAMLDSVQLKHNGEKLASLLKVPLREIPPGPCEATYTGFRHETKDGTRIEPNVQLINNWARLGNDIDLIPVINKMLEQNSINYETHRELSEMKNQQREAVCKLLNWQRRKGKFGISQLVNAFRDTDFQQLALLLDPPIAEPESVEEIKKRKLRKFNKAKELKEQLDDWLTRSRLACGIDLADQKVAIFIEETELEEHMASLNTELASITCVGEDSEQYYKIIKLSEPLSTERNRKVGAGCRASYTMAGQAKGSTLGGVFINELELDVEHRPMYIVTTSHLQDARGMTFTFPTEHGEVLGECVAFIAQPSPLIEACLVKIDPNAAAYDNCSPFLFKGQQEIQAVSRGPYAGDLSDLLLEPKEVVLWGAASEVTKGTMRATTIGDLKLVQYDFPDPEDRNRKIRGGIVTYPGPQEMAIGQPGDSGGWITRSNEQAFKVKDWYNNRPMRNPLVRHADSYPTSIVIATPSSVVDVEPTDDDGRQAAAATGAAAPLLWPPEQGDDVMAYEVISAHCFSQRHPHPETGKMVGVSVSFRVDHAIEALQQQIGGILMLVPGLDI